MSRIKHTTVLTAALLLITTGVFVFAGGEKDIHPFTTSSRYCKKCHESETFEHPDKACSQYCQTCHKGISESHHPIDVRLKKQAEVELTSSQRLTCRTCHNLLQKRYDMASWRAESLYERVFRKENSYRTYLLHIKNTNGELCKKCHQ